MSIRLNNFCHFDCERNCYVISHEYHMSIYIEGCLIKWKKTSDEDNPRTIDELSRIDFAYIGPQKMSYQIDGIVTWYKQTRKGESSSQQPIDLIDYLIEQYLDNPVFSKIVSNGPDYQNITLGQFLTSEERQSNLIAKVEKWKKELRLRRYADFKFILGKLAYHGNPNTRTFYKDMYKGIPHLIYDPYSYLETSRRFDIEIKTKDKTYIIASTQQELYNRLYHLFTEGTFMPSNYSETFEGEMWSREEGESRIENINDCINEFNSMMDEEGGWENID